MLKIDSLINTLKELKKKGAEIIEYELTNEVRDATPLDKEYNDKDYVNAKFPRDFHIYI